MNIIFLLSVFKHHMLCVVLCVVLGVCVCVSCVCVLCGCVCCVLGVACCVLCVVCVCVACVVRCGCCVGCMCCGCVVWVAGFGYVECARIIRLGCVITKASITSHSYLLR